VITWIVVAAHVLGIVSAVNALMTTRTSQGAIAWIVALISFPYASVPAYWVFGRSKFHGYVLQRRSQGSVTDEKVREIVRSVEPYVSDLAGTQGEALAMQRLAKMRFLRGNEVELLIDGQATFDSILHGIDRAEHYVLVQFYIVRDDGLGRALKERLIGRCRSGVKVWFLYDEVGSKDLPRSFVAELTAAGVRVSPFQSTLGLWNRFQINFRNHRKIVVVDGRVGWVGGSNVGDEYLGKNPRIGPWRDTHVRIAGPAVVGLQASFLEDWHWAVKELLPLAWEPHPAIAADVPVLILPTGPADELETASLMFQQAIHLSSVRIWIASPYFVPDHGVLSALQLAALRGVDVRVLIPERPDKRLVWFSAFAFVGPLLECGVQICRYQPGFLHQKVFLVDDYLAGVGTANFDNRSFRLNFEVTALIVDPGFAAQVDRMLARDFASARQMTVAQIRAKPWWFRLAARAAYLLAPVQ
jgi:cardiolipin synthase